MRALFDGDGAGDDRPGDPTGSPQSLLGAHEHVGHVLVLTQQREVQDDLQGLCIRSHHDELRDASVEGFGGCREKDMKSTGAGAGKPQQSNFQGKETGARKMGKNVQV